jgi:nitrate reductase gamma subunit
MERLSEFSYSPDDRLVVKELDGLIELAEECVKKIDSLTASIEKMRVYNIVLFAIAALMLSAGLGMLLDVRKADITFFTASPGVFAFLFFLFAMTVGVAWTVAAGQARRRTLYRELFAERDVHHRLISLLHEQTQRVAHRNAVSPVTHAMIEIRIRRLMR